MKRVSGLYPDNDVLLQIKDWADYSLLRMPALYGAKTFILHAGSKTRERILNGRKGEVYEDIVI